jgi:hypothetical protein
MRARAGRLTAVVSFIPRQDGHSATNVVPIDWTATLIENEAGAYDDQHTVTFLERFSRRLVELQSRGGPRRWLIDVVTIYVVDVGMATSATFDDPQIDDASGKRFRQHRARKLQGDPVFEKVPGLVSRVFSAVGPIYAGDSDEGIEPDHAPYTVFDLLRRKRLAWRESIDPR